MATLSLFRTAQGRFVSQTKDPRAQVIGAFLAYDIAHATDFLRAILISKVPETVILDSCTLYTDEEKVIIEPRQSHWLTLQMSKEYAMSLLYQWEEFVFSAERQLVIVCNEQMIIALAGYSSAHLSIQ